MNKTEDEAYNLIKQMTPNNYQWCNKRGQLKRVGGKFELDALTLLTAKMDAMIQILDCLNFNVMHACAPPLLVIGVDLLMM